LGLDNLNIDSLAVLRLDGDMYSSTIQVLEKLYDKVSIGGYIIIDDYALPGCEKATSDFRNSRGITDPLIDIDGTGAFWRKS
jgi:O-methyltransferase